MNKALKRHKKKSFAETPYWLTNLLSTVERMTHETKMQTIQILNEMNGSR